MEEQTEDTKAHKRLVKDLSHFIGLRRGFGTPGELFVGKLLAFTPDDFTWELTDVYESDRSVSCSLVGTPTEDTAAHIEMLVDQRGYSGGLPVVSRYKGALRDAPSARTGLKIEWHHKGCRNDAQKAQRATDARDQLENDRTFALHAASRGRKLDACHNFNERMASIIKQINQRYTETWLRTLTEGDRAWALSGDKTEAKTKLADLDTEISNLHTAVRAMRDKLTSLRDERHQAFNQLVVERLDKEGWTDNDDKKFPGRLVEAAMVKLTEERERGFGD